MKGIQKKNNKGKLKDLLDNIKPKNIYNIQYTTNIYKILDPRTRRKQRAQNINEEIIAKKFPNLGMKIDVLIQEAHREFQIECTQGGPYLTLLTITKMTEVKGKKKMLKVARQTHKAICRGNSMRYQLIINYNK